MKKMKEDIQNFLHSVKILFAASPKYFIAKLIVTIISAVLPFAPYYLWRGLLNMLVDYVTDSRAEILSSIVLFTILYCLIQLIQSIFSSIEKVVSYKYNDEVSYYLDNILIDKMAHIDLAYFDSSKLKDKMNYTAQMMQPCTLGLLDYMLSITQQMVWLIFATIIVSQLNIVLVIIIILLTIITFLGEKFLGNKERLFRREHSKEERRLGYYRSLFFGNSLHDVKLFNLKGYFSQLYKTQWKQLYKARLNMNIKSCFINCANLILITASEICAYVSTVNKLVAGVIGVGDVTYYVSIATQFRSRLSWLLGDINGYRQTSLDFSDVQNFINMKPVLEKQGTLSPSLCPRIEFCNVSFKYPNAENWVLKQCSFIIEPGEVVGLVGLNGSGKSTIVKLLCRFYDPIEGNIFIDGIDAREYDIVKLRALFSVMFQDFCTYSFTLRESIALSDLTRINDNNALMDACKKSHVSEFCKDWDKGIDEELTRQFSPTGKELSTGQWQRIALARAFFRETFVALLDEPSASLDPIAEHDVFTKFLQLSEQKSVLLISHRLSSITLADRIIVLENGHIIENGSHDTLLKQKGRYAYLFNLQAKKYN